MRLEKTDNVRAISRGLSVLQIINQSGSISLMGISTKTNLPYPTTCRIVQTLLDEGMIEQEAGSKRYRATALVHTLSNGFQIEDLMVAKARPHIVDVTRDLIWPVSLCTCVGLDMVVRDSTHRLTSLTFSIYRTGMKLPVLESSCGQAFLAFCGEAERATFLRGFLKVNSERPELRKLVAESLNRLDRTRRLGFATSECKLNPESSSRNSSIAVPVFSRGEIAGSLALTFFSSAMGMERAVNEFVGRLKSAASDIERSVEIDGSVPSQPTAAGRPIEAA